MIRGRQKHCLLEDSDATRQGLAGMIPCGTSRVNGQARRWCQGAAGRVVQAPARLGKAISRTSQPVSVGKGPCSSPAGRLEFPDFWAEGSDHAVRGEFRQIWHTIPHPLPAWQFGPTGFIVHDDNHASCAHCRATGKHYSLAHTELSHDQASWPDKNL